jgi:hypothetical protein
VKRTKWAGRLLLFSFVVLCANARMQAQQTTASIRGLIVDASGGVVRDASVTVTQVHTDISRNLLSDSQGNFVFVELPVGSYRLEVAARGFRKFVQEGITLHVNQAASVRIQLAVGIAAQTIKVNENAAMIETTSTNLGTTVGDREILDLPLNGRHFTQLGVLQTGVVPITPGLALAGGTLREGQAYAVNGQRPESNNFLIDGSDSRTAPVEIWRRLPVRPNQRFAGNREQRLLRLRQLPDNQSHGQLPIWSACVLPARGRRFFARPARPGV